MESPIVFEAAQYPDAFDLASNYLWSYADSLPVRYHRTARIRHVANGEFLQAHPGATTILDAEYDPPYGCLVFDYDGMRIRLENDRAGIVGSDLPRVIAHRAKLLELFPPEAESEIDFVFWGSGRSGLDVQHNNRDVETPPWADIRSNYGAGCARAIDRLMSYHPPASGGGKIGIIYGLPGTGKTHLIQSLAHEWSDWAEVTYVLDVATFFSKPDYMFRLTLRAESDEAKWLALVFEDADDYLTGETEKEAMSRLLNIGGGLVGQGLKVLLLFTTATHYVRFDESLVREGRCFAQVEVPLLTAGEASKWLREPVYEATSLAKLYARKDATEKITYEAGDHGRVGSYL